MLHDQIGPGGSVVNKKGTLFMFAALCTLDCKSAEWRGSGVGGRPPKMGGRPPTPFGICRRVARALENPTDHMGRLLTP